ncbi:Carboxypeptidase activation peptide [Popillia japonica]|uniref:Carboxypeptidase activation peptide n=1 Tax=Popillia japonica TaxID=7064 RepID=A0AAW1HVL6_POPJA
MKHLLILSSLWISIGSEYSSYDGYKVYQLLPSNEEQLALIRSFNYHQSIDFWSEPKILGKPTTVMVPPNLQASFTSTLFSRQMKNNLL